MALSVEKKTDVFLIVSHKKLVKSEKGLLDINSAFQNCYLAGAHVKTSFWTTCKGNPQALDVIKLLMLYSCNGSVASTSWAIIQTSLFFFLQWKKIIFSDGYWFSYQLSESVCKMRMIKIIFCSNVFYDSLNIQNFFQDMWQEKFRG